MPLTRVATLLSDARPDETVTARGWVRTRRDSKNGFSFIELNDGSCMKNLQIVVDADVPGYSDSIKSVTTGASIAVEGTVKESPGKGQRIELHATSLNVLGTADPATFPLQKKGHSFEFLRDIAHLRPRSNSFGAVARVRNATDSIDIGAEFGNTSELRIRFAAADNDPGDVLECGVDGIDFQSFECTQDNDCLADVNGDGMVTPTDFTAWVGAFNSGAPECDQNGDGMCTPTDFTAWVGNYNAGCN